MGATAAREGLRALVQSMDSTTRLILMLHYVDRLTPSEIAAATDVDSDHVRHVLSHIRDHALLAMQPKVPAPAHIDAIVTADQA